MKASACLLSANIGEDLFLQKLERERWGRPPPPLPPQRLPHKLALAKELAESKSYAQMSPMSMRALIFLTCHYEMEGDTIPLVARLISRCESQHTQFEPLLRCADQVMLGPLLDWSQDFSEP